MDPNHEPTPDPAPTTHYFCPRHGPYREPVAAEGGIRLEGGAVMRECLACVVQKLYDERKDGR